MSRKKDDLQEQDKAEKEYRKRVNDNGGFEKKDIPALILSALLTFLPICTLILLAIYFLARIFIGM